MQKLRHEVPHVTYFYRAGEPVPPAVQAAEVAGAAARARAGAGVAPKADEVLPPP